MKSLLFQIKSQLNQREFKVTFALLYVLSIERLFGIVLNIIV